MPLDFDRPAMQRARALATAERPAVWLHGAALSPEAAAEVRADLRAAVRACRALEGRRAVVTLLVCPEAPAPAR